MGVSTPFVTAGALLCVVAFATTGCATKKYVRQQTGIVSARVDEVDKKQTEAQATLDQKMQRDVSRVEERAISADSRAAEAARAAQAAQSTATAADQAAKSATDLATRTQSELGELTESVANIDRFQVLTSADVLFGFNRSSLTDEGKLLLDKVVEQAASQRRYVIEVQGYTDRRGSSAYNLALSRRRADVVVRYLIDRGVALRQVRMIGLGESLPAADHTAAPGTPAAKAKQMRKVVVTLYGPDAKLWTGKVGQAPAAGPSMATAQPPR